MSRRTLALVGSLTALLVPAIAAGDWVDGPQNVVRVENTTDNTVRSKARISVARASSSDTEAGNLAWAYSHDCTGCQSLAAAFQAVFLASDNTSFRPQNVGLAVNERCTGCGSFAYAYQYVLTADRKPKLRDDDRERVRDLQREASDLLRSGRPYPEIDAGLKDVAARFRALIDDAVNRADIDVDDRKATERHDEDSFEG